MNGQHKSTERRAPKLGEVTAIDVETSSGRTAIPAEWKNNWVTLFADGGDVYVVYNTEDDGDATVTTAMPIKDDAGFVDLFFPGNAAYLIHIGSAECMLLGYPSSPRTPTGRY